MMDLCVHKRSLELYELSSIDLSFRKVLYFVGDVNRTYVWWNIDLFCHVASIFKFKFVDTYRLVLSGKAFICP